MIAILSSQASVARYHKERKERLHARDMTGNGGSLRLLRREFRLSRLNADAQRCRLHHSPRVAIAAATRGGGLGTRWGDQRTPSNDHVSPSTVKARRPCPPNRIRLSPVAAMTAKERGGGPVVVISDHFERSQLQVSE